VKDIVEILKPRAEIGLVKGAINLELIEKIAELAEGDARIAIQMLRKSAENAELEGRRKISEKDVEKAWESFRKQRQSYLLSKLNRDQNILYQIIEENPGIESSEIYRKYEEKAGKLGIRPIAARTVRKYLCRLIELGLIKIEGEIARRRKFEIAA